MKPVFLLFILLATNAQAQNKLQFQSYNSIGLVEGEKGTSSVIESVNGLGLKKWFVGAGVALDHYTYRTTPVYLQLRKEFRKPVFVFLSGGESFPWVKTTNENSTWVKTKFYPELYYEGGLGYRWTIGRQSIFLSGGYSQKKLEEIKTYRSGICIGWNCQPQTIEKFNHRLRTLVLKAGIRF